MYLSIPSSFAIDEKLKLSLFEDGSGFVFKHGKIAFDFHYELNKEGLLIVLNDDASWGNLTWEGETLKGRLYSHIAEPKNINWDFKKIALMAKPQANTALQAVRFHDLEALEYFTQDATKLLWNELLIEAATCGHEKLLLFCLSRGADLHVDIENFQVDEKASCFALTKAIQCGHSHIVALLLEEKAHIHHHTFDLDRDNFYHACFLYQVRAGVGEKVIEMLLASGVDFSAMSAYYLSALMYSYPQGPLHKAKEDTKMLQRVIKAGARVDDFLMISAHEKDTALMFAAHMGLFKALKELVNAGANVFESFKGKSALDRLLTPIVIDPHMPHNDDEEIRKYLESLGLRQKPIEFTEAEEEIKVEQENEAKKEGLSALKGLFVKIK